MTDVVLPSGSGREVASELTVVRPELAVLYMSGYTDNVIGRRCHCLAGSQNPTKIKSAVAVVAAQDCGEQQNIADKNGGKSLDGPRAQEAKSSLQGLKPLNKTWPLRRSRDAGPGFPPRLVLQRTAKILI